MALVLWKPSLLTEMHKDYSEADLIVGPTVKLHHDGKGTGALLWSAGVALARCLINQNAARQLTGLESIEAAYCLEVGGGLGIVSIAARRAGATKVVCTDGEDKVVAVAQKNLDLDYNENGDGAAGSTEHDEHALQKPLAEAGGLAALLSWGDEAAAKAILALHGDNPPDLVLVADCVFGEDLRVWAALRETLTTLCASPTTTLVIAQTERYPAREAKFFQKLLKVFEVVSSFPAVDIVPGYKGQVVGPPVTLWTLKRCK